MDYEYHIDYWAYERNKKDVENVRPVLAKYCPNTMAFWDRTVVQMDAALKFYEKLQDQLDYNYGDATGVRKMQDTLREVAEDAIDKFYDNLIDEYAVKGVPETFYDELTAHDNIRAYRGDDFARQYMARRPDLFPRRRQIWSISMRLRNVPSPSATTAVHPINRAPSNIVDVSLSASMECHCCSVAKRALP